MIRTALASVLVAAAPAVAAQQVLNELAVPPAPTVTARFGTAVAGIGDVNGDDRGDLVVGAPRAGLSPALDGRVMVYSGADGALLHTLSVPGTTQFGVVVDAVPDADGDGVPDVLVGAPTTDGPEGTLQAGTAYVFSGSDGSLLHALSSPDEQYQAQFGTAVAGLPDVDGDGRGDLAVGAYEGDGGVVFSGRAYVFSGATGALVHTLVSPNRQIRGNFGLALAGVPDLDGDGRGEILVGAHGEDDVYDGAGVAYVFNGATGAALGVLHTTAPSENSNFGAAVAAVPDVDGDGYADLLVGARYEDDDYPLAAIGRAYVFSGKDHVLLRQLVPPSPQRDGFFGSAVAGLDDIDGDGHGDVLIGAHTTFPEGAPYRAGRAYVFSGASGDLLATLASPNEQTAGLFGTAVAGVPDADGDGLMDLLLGASVEDRGGLSDGGNAYVFSGALAPTSASPRGPGGALALRPASPNPFTGSTFFRFDLPEAGAVRLAVYDALGRCVAVLADGSRAAGAHAVPFEAGPLPAGAYVVRLEAAGRVATQWVSLVR